MLLRHLCLLLFNKELESRWPTPHAHLIRPLGLPLLDALRCLLSPSLFFNELPVKLSEQVLVDRKTLVPLAPALVSSLDKLSVLDCCGSAVTTGETLIVAVCDLAEDVLMQRHSLTVLVGGGVQLRQQRGEFQGRAVKPTPYTSEVVADVFAEVDGIVVLLLAAEARFDKTAADPNNDSGRPCLLDNPG